MGYMTQPAVRKHWRK